MLVADDPAALERAPAALPEVDGSGAGVLVPLSTTERTLTVLEAGQPPRELGEVDVVFPLLHGPFGEDGTLQGLLELVATSATSAPACSRPRSGMDKHYMKVLLRRPRPAGRPVRRHHRPAVAAATRRRPGRLASLGCPLFVKPARAGSSMGITKVDRPAATCRPPSRPRVSTTPRSWSRPAIVGREIECAVLQGRDGAAPRTSEVGEIAVRPGPRLLRLRGQVPRRGRRASSSCPADMPPEVAAEVRRVAAAAFEAMGCEGLARVDCFYTETARSSSTRSTRCPGSRRTRCTRGCGPPPAWTTPS